MLIEHLLAVGEDSPEAQLLVTDPNTFYGAAREEFDGDPAFADRARTRVVALQAGDPDTLRLWDELVDLSKQYFNRIYATLGVTLTDADLAGESTYNAELAQICDELEAAGLATMSDGALCVFLDGYTGREGKPVPLIIRKSDGGYGYATTDLATIRHRVRDLQVRPDPLRHRRPAGAAPQHGLGHRPQGRLAARRRRGRARPDRQRARSGPQDPAYPRRQPAQADGPARGGHRARPRGRRRGPARPRPRRPRGDRAAGRHRGREVRRPGGGARQRVRLRPRPDGLAHRQHRALPAVRRRADPLDLPHGRHLTGRRRRPRSR